MTVDGQGGFDDVTATSFADVFKIDNGDATAAGVGAGSVETINGFDKAADKIDLQTSATLGAAETLGSYSIDASGKVTYTTLPTSLSDLITAVQGLVTGNGEVGFVEYGGGTYVFQENGGTDTLVFLDGVTGITDFSSTAGDSNTLWIA